MNKTLSQIWRPRIYLLISIASTVLLSGCTHPWVESGFSTERSQTKPKVSLDEYQALTDEAELLQRENNELRNQLSELEVSHLQQQAVLAQIQLALLSKQAEVNQLLSEQQIAIQEMVRTQAKLRSRNSRAETVAALAEATVIINNAREKASDNQNILISRAEALLDMSHQALEEGNFDGASYLASQSESMVTSILAATPTNQSPNNNYEILFAMRLPMQVRVNANVRKLPSSKASILTTISSGLTVEASGYSGEWVHVHLPENQSGWVYYNLLSVN